MNNIYFITSMIVLGIAFLITLLLLPFIIKVANHFNLFDQFNNRKIHMDKIPNIGGLGIFLGFIISQSFYVLEIPFLRTHMEGYYLLLYSTILLFLLGFIDDIMRIEAKKKFSIQVLIAFILVWRVDLRIESFQGLFGIFELPLWVSYIFSIMVLLFFVNAYNLIDGLDGLSTSMGIYVLTIFFGIFYINNLLIESMIALSLIGSLLGFLVFNKPPARIFMGDCGSLSIGIIIAFFSIRVAGLPLDPIGIISPVFSMLVLSYPAIDTLRVFFIRLSKSKSPFSADKEHIHHSLLDLGLSHGNSTMIILSVSIIVSIIAYQLRAYPNLSFFILVPIIIILSYIPSLFSIKGRK